MSKSFSESKELQALNKHVEALTKKGFDFLEDYSRDNQKLHDLYDWVEGAWIECKTDKDRFTERLLIEVYANVPIEWVESLPPRRPFARGLRYEKTIIDIAERLPPRMKSLATDKANLEPRHYLSYLMEQTDEHYLIDLRQLQEQIANGSYQWLIGGHDDEPWRSICQIVPVEEIKTIQSIGWKRGKA